MKRSVLIFAGIIIAAGLVGVLAPKKPTPPARQIAPHAPTIPQASLRYFQRRLIEDGDDIHSGFGLDLAALGLKGRELQAMPIAEAYVRVHEQTLRLSDVRDRRRFLLELFNEVEE